jgi:hypothetical protein
MNRRLLLVAAIMAIAAAGGLAARGAIERIVITPLLGGLWLAWQLLDSLPQALVWGSAWLIALTLAIRGAWLLPRPAARPAAGTPPVGRVAGWQRLVALARRDRYSRWRLAHRCASMLIEHLCLTQRIDASQARARLAAGQIALTGATLAFVRAGLDGYHADRRVARGAHPLDADLQAVADAIAACIADDPGAAQGATHEPD